ncbi:LLM class F420-dependent oxidoreductase [Reticulibacter mediterranei]|uniref:LLM class F420-dependent oxidoreductase n=1 Tax=Reticulibacter mediterranei TaxID=2778369 RepID=A0A8J3IP55_9CHLR|nr:LLM class flavin-dependent oxidoreductase [Reticulibacter mediterranei]GHO98171.1 LLM class F420-dependent oxidoreductase [Reticulibacter mediterranei]
MRVGLQISTATIPQTPTGESLAYIAEQADQAGFSTLVMPDHFTLRPESAPWARMGDSSTPAVIDFFEAWSVLSFLAARTSRIKLSTLVSGITMRYPAVLIKTVDTLDALSNGRAYLGVGASPNFGRDEHERMGLPFPPAGERIARLEEVLQMALQMWSGEDKPFEGKYYQLTSSLGAPFFVQQPHPPILIAGHGEKMLRLMARYADIVSVGFGQDLDDMQKKLEFLRQQCEILHRPYEAIEKTTFYTPPVLRDGHLDPAALDAIDALAKLGVDEIMVRPPSDAEAFEIYATEFIPAVNNIAVAGR